MRKGMYVLIGVILIIFIYICVENEFQQHEEKRGNKIAKERFEQRVAKIKSPRKRDYLVVRIDFLKDNTPKSYSSLFKIKDFEKDSIGILVPEILQIYFPWRDKNTADSFFYPKHLFRYRKVAKADLIESVKSKHGLYANDLFDERLYNLTDLDLKTRIKVDRVE